MKVTMFHKILIAVLLLVAWGYLSFTYIITPARDKIEPAQQELDTATLRQRAANKKIQELSTLAGNEAIEDGRITKGVKDYFSVFDYKEENLVAFIHNLAESSEISITDIISGGIVTYNLDTLFKSAQAAKQDYPFYEILYGNGNDPGDTDTEVPIDSKPADDAVNNTVYAYSMILNFSASSYEQVTGFMKGFEALGKFAVINNVSLKASLSENEEEGPVLNGSLTVNLMTIDSALLIKAVFPDVEIIAPIGKDNPFEAIPRPDDQVE